MGPGAPGVPERASCRAAAPVASRLPLWPSRHDRRRPWARAHAAIFVGHSPGLASRLADHSSGAPRGRRSMHAARRRPAPPAHLAPRPLPALRCIRPDPLAAHTDLFPDTSNRPIRDATYPSTTFTKHYYSHECRINHIYLETTSLPQVVCSFNNILYCIGDGAINLYLSAAGKQ